MNFNTDVESEIVVLINKWIVDNNTNNNIKYFFLFVKDRPVLTIGNNILTGIKQKLSKPLIVTEKKAIDVGDDKKELKVVAIIKSKIVFKHRPKIVLMNSSPSNNKLRLSQIKWYLDHPKEWKRICLCLMWELTAICSLLWLLCATNFPFFFFCLFMFF